MSSFFCCSLKGLPQWIIPRFSMLPFTTSINLNNLCPIYQLSLLYTCSNHLNLISPFNLSCPCDKLISTDIHSGHFQLTFKHLQLCHLQLNLPSFCECHLLQTIHRKSSYCHTTCNSTRFGKSLRIWNDFRQDTFPETTPPIWHKLY